ncbi:MAG: hypothetical protein H0T92_21345 [Pyrinomonadaceae bacterium]|nr:hypothetical protein [Pyrinomonadaceae bacterium]
MKIYLLNFNNGQHAFYSEGLEDVAEDAASATSQGVRVKLERKYKEWQTTLGKAESGMGLRVRRIWEWLQQRTSHDEVLLRDLRSAAAIELYHPTMMTTTQTLAAWTNYLARQRRYHLLWFTVDTLISLLTVPLMVIPGPNIIGYPFAYRAICHGFALLGIRNARSGEVTTMLEPLGTLDQSFGRDEGQATRRAASLKLKNVEAFVKRVMAQPEETQRNAPLVVR